MIVKLSKYKQRTNSKFKWFKCHICGCESGCLENNHHKNYKEGVICLFCDRYLNRPETIKLDYKKHLQTYFLGGDLGDLHVFEMQIRLLRSYLLDVSKS